MKKLILFLGSLILLTGCTPNFLPVQTEARPTITEVSEPSETASSDNVETIGDETSIEESEENIESSDTVAEEDFGISYTVEEAINAVAEVFRRQIYDYSDEQGPYFVTGANYSLATVSADYLKSYVPRLMPEGFELNQDWATGYFANGLEYEGCLYLCKNVVLDNQIYETTYTDGTPCITLKIAAYLSE